MGDQGSIYSVLQDVPIMVSPHYQLPKQIFIASELIPIPDSIATMSTYTFNVEKDALKTMSEARKQQEDERQRLTQLEKQYQEERIQQQKLAARKIAPGFLDTDTRILKPEPLHHQQGEDTVSAQSNIDNNNNTTTRAAHVDYLRFEQSLAPPDPWDSPENDIVALRSLLGPNHPATMAATAAAAAAAAAVGSSGNGNTSNNSSIPPSSSSTSSLAIQMPQPQQQHPAAVVAAAAAATTVSMPSTYPQPMMWAPEITNAAAGLYRVRHASSPPAAPALPPKPFFDSSATPSSTHTSPRTVAASIASPAELPPVAAIGPPPLPPPPTPLSQNQVPEDLIMELVNMGFSRPQAADALEKNDLDLMKATNFLLDHGAG